MSEIAEDVKATAREVVRESFRDPLMPMWPAIAKASRMNENAAPRSLTASDQRCLPRTSMKKLADLAYLSA